MSDFRWDKDLLSNLFTSNQTLVEMIEKHGIDSEDKFYKILVYYLSYLPFEQIDIVFRYKPEPKLTKVRRWFYWPIIEWTADDKDIYIIRKLLDNDDQGLYVRSKVNLCADYKNITHKMTILEMFELAIKLKNNTRVFGYYIEWPRLMSHYYMINSHKNKHFTLFEHLKYLLYEKSIKRRRFQ